MIGVIKLALGSKVLNISGARTLNPTVPYIAKNIQSKIKSSRWGL
jgi:hypothetical protein